MVYMHDVAEVHDGNAVQTNIVHVDGNRSVLLSVFKNGTTSTLEIVGGIKRMLQIIKHRCGRARHQANRRSVDIRARCDLGAWCAKV